MGRAFSLGVTLAAPAVVMSAILGWQLPITVLAICVPMIVYTSIGGVQAVAWTDVKQMFIIVVGHAGRRRRAGHRHPAARGLRTGAASGRRDRAAATPSISGSICARPTRSGRACIGGLFLMLSYFGCDQSQVQRYLTAKSDRRRRAAR